MSVNYRTRKFILVTGFPVRYLFLCIIAFLFAQCGDKNSKNGKSKNQKDSIALQKDKVLLEEERLKISYHLFEVKEHKEWLNSLKPGDTLNALMVLNRVDQKYLARQDSLIMPDTFVADLNIYSPFPGNIVTLKEVKKIIIFSYYAQAYGVYEYGNRVRWGGASMGKQSTPTLKGLHFTNWKSKRAISTVDNDWIMNWYFNIDNARGIAMHEFALPGYPASHSCIRLSQVDANWIYYWADQWELDSSKIAAYGTPVIVYGNYPFGERKPWLNLAEDSSALQINEKEIKAEVDGFIPLILQRQVQRDTLLAEKALTNELISKL